MRPDRKRSWDCWRTIFQGRRKGEKKDGAMEGKKRESGNLDRPKKKIKTLRKREKRRDWFVAEGG